MEAVSGIGISSDSARSRSLPDSDDDRTCRSARSLPERGGTQRVRLSSRGSGSDAPWVPLLAPRVGVVPQEEVTRLLGGTLAREAAFVSTPKQDGPTYAR